MPMSVVSASESIEIGCIASIRDHVPFGAMSTSGP